mgnify:CR=1 FL=1
MQTVSININTFPDKTLVKIHINFPGKCWQVPELRFIIGKLLENAALISKFFSFQIESFTKNTVKYKFRKIIAKPTYQIFFVRNLYAPPGFCLQKLRSISEKIQNPKKFWQKCTNPNQNQNSGKCIAKNRKPSVGFLAHREVNVQIK